MYTRVSSARGLALNVCLSLCQKYVYDISSKPHLGRSNLADTPMNAQIVGQPEALKKFLAQVSTGPTPGCCTAVAPLAPLLHRCCTAVARLSRLLGASTCALPFFFPPSLFFSLPLSFSPSLPRFLRPQLAASAPA